MRIRTEYLGVSWPQYFSGFSALEYCYVAIGAGDTEQAALEDAIENLATVVEDGLPEDVEKAIRDNYGEADDAVSALEALGADIDDGNDDLQEFPYHYVGVAYDPD